MPIKELSHYLKSYPAEQFLTVYQVCKDNPEGDDGQENVEEGCAFSFVVRLAFPMSFYHVIFKKLL